MLCVLRRAARSGLTHIFFHFSSLQATEFLLERDLITEKLQRDLDISEEELQPGHRPPVTEMASSADLDDAMDDRKIRFYDEDLDFLDLACTKLAMGRMLLEEGPPRRASKAASKRTGGRRLDVIDSDSDSTISDGTDTEGDDRSTDSLEAAAAAALGGIFGKDIDELVSLDSLSDVSCDCSVDMWLLSDPTWDHPVGRC